MTRTASYQGQDLGNVRKGAEFVLIATGNEYAAHGLAVSFSKTRSALAKHIGTRYEASTVIGIFPLNAEGHTAL